jgi:hypothetical protein
MFPLAPLRTVLDGHGPAPKQLVDCFGPASINMADAWTGERYSVRKPQLAAGWTRPVLVVSAGRVSSSVR